MGSRRNPPKPSFPSWEYRVKNPRWADKYKERAKGAFEERKRRPDPGVYLPSMSEARYAYPERTVEASHHDVPSEFNQLRIHVYNMARVVLEHSALFSKFTVSTAEMISERAGAVSPTMKDGHYSTLTSRGAQLFEADSDLREQLAAVEQHMTDSECVRQQKNQIFSERRAQYDEFIGGVRTEVREMIRKALVSGQDAPIRLRELIDFWHPGQRREMDGFVKRNSQLIQDLAGIAFTSQPQRAVLEEFLSYFGSKPKLVPNPLGGFDIAHGAPLRKYIQAMHALDELSGHLRVYNSRYDEPTQRKAKQFNQLYNSLKSALVYTKRRE